MSYISILMSFQNISSINDDITECQHGKFGTAFPLKSDNPDSRTIFLNTSNNTTKYYPS